MGKVNSQNPRTQAAMRRGEYVGEAIAIRRQTAIMARRLRTGQCR
jgi:hypothetical protein